MEIIEGTILQTTLRNNSGSRYLLITPEIMDYLGITETDTLVIKFERSKKYGNYIGVGKNKMK